jgi:hypothetical protein
MGMPDTGNAYFGDMRRVAGLLQRAWSLAIPPAAVAPVVFYGVLLYDWVWYAFLVGANQDPKEVIGVFAVVLVALWSGFHSVLSGEQALAVIARRVAGLAGYVLWSFSTLYFELGTHGFVGAPLSRVDAAYFALGTFSTAGTGSIAPLSQGARALVAVQYAVDVLFVAGVLGILIGRLSSRHR